MDIKKVNKAVSILEDSNRLLKGRMDELRHALEKSILPKDDADPYSVLEHCEAEYEAVEMAIRALQSESHSDVTDLRKSWVLCWEEPTGQRRWEAFHCADGVGDKLIELVNAYNEFEAALHPGDHEQPYGAMDFEDKFIILCLHPSADRISIESLPEYCSSAWVTNNSDPAVKPHFGYKQARADIVKYLQAQPEKYFKQRGRSKDEVLNDTETIANLACEHIHCVSQSGIDREWSCKDACDHTPGIRKNDEEGDDLV